MREQVKLGEEEENEEMIGKVKREEEKEMERIKREKGRRGLEKVEFVQDCYT